MTQKVNSSRTVKFLYSYGGKIVPRPTDGKLRYVGGFTRVLAVDRFITLSELLVKFGESCGSSMDLKCKLPTEDLDVLISIRSDEELRVVMEEYERICPEAKIIAVLFPMKSAKKVSPPSSTVQFPLKSAKRVSPPSSPVSCFDFPSVSKPFVTTPFVQRYQSVPPRAPLRRRLSPVVGHPVAAVRHCYYESRSSRQYYHVHGIRDWDFSSLHGNTPLSPLASMDSPLAFLSI